MFSTAQLSIFFGKVPLRGRANLKQVKEVLALGRETFFTRQHQFLRPFLLCNGTTTALRNLEWSRGSHVVRYKVYMENALLVYINAHLSIAVGIYTCKDTVTGNKVSINITDGECKISFYFDIKLNLWRSKFGLYIC